MKKILVVGAGLAGATLARELADFGYHVDVIDKRDHVAGNAYDYVDEDGFRIHKYGPHLFHTNNDEVFDWLSRFTDWESYEHKVKGLLSDGSFVTIPPNRDTRRILGDKGIVDVLIRPYTEKMWGIVLEDLDPKILNRIPVRDDNNELYFPDDKHQYLPKQGYTQLVQNILDHASINTRLGVRFKKEMEAIYYHTFNSMPVDEYFDYCYGALPYRSIKFKHLKFPTSTLFPTAQTNFTHSGPETRVTEWRHLPGHGGKPTVTAITIEEPCDYLDNHYERYYPVKDVHGKNRKLYKQYRSLIPENVTFIGRCGQYVYLDMHQAIGSSLAIAHRFVSSFNHGND